MKIIKGFLINLQFFTTIPIRLQLPMDKDHLRRSVQTFPILGLLQGIVYSAVLYSLLHWTPFSPLSVAFMVLVLMIVMTGGLHLDGWMDTADAFFSYREKEKRLEIMADPRIGAFGVISVIILLGGRLLFLYEVILRIEPATYFLIACIPFFSKSVMGYLLLMVPTAKQEGMAYFFKRDVNKRSLFVYFIYLSLVIFVLSLISFSVVMYGLLLVAVVFALILYFKRKIVRSFGGMTGDVLGASVEGMEFILWMTIWLLHYYAMG